MKTIALKIDKDTFNKLNVIRGGETISSYLRRLIIGHLSGERSTKTAIDIETVRALAIYLTEILRIANAPAYATQSDKIKNLFSQFMDRLEERRNEK
ncbi:MAG: hypothetical protein BWY69_00940 [Planctomycetes bacterium ADurb.Bin401]|nr:MAG: hypothetical protein BWY69_00940 [Planctomycetes bacterium ADurb.Bin401]